MSGNRAARRAALQPHARRDRPGRGGRIAFLPAVLGGVVLLASTGAGGDVLTVVRFAVAILGAIVAVFAVQARAWWWTAPVALVVVAWNPVVPIALPAAWLPLARYGGAAVLLAAGLTIRRPD